MKMKKIGLILLGLLVIGLVSAAVVDYLSNRATATITVGTPLVNEVSADGVTDWRVSINIGSFDGNPVDIYLRTKNKLSTVVTGIPNDRITGTNITCEDFLDVTVDDVSKIGTCVNVDDSILTFTLRNGTFPASTTEIYNISISFKDNAMGTYTYESQVMV